MKNCIGCLIILVFSVQALGQTSEKLGMVSYTFRNSFQKDVAATLDTI